MSSPQTLESQLLKKAEHVLEEFTARHPDNPIEARFQLLEAAASQYGGWDLKKFNKHLGSLPLLDSLTLNSTSLLLKQAIDNCGIPSALALSALGREALNASQQRTTGAYHTDFRLAQRLAQPLATCLNKDSKIIDPACGAGILLVALTLSLCKGDKETINHFLENGLFAADLSLLSLRGATLALGSLTDDLDVIFKMRSHWMCGDSLTTRPEHWQTMAPEGFDGVIANPPWERIRTTRHEWVKEQGKSIVYGEQPNASDTHGLKESKTQSSLYAQQLSSRYREVLGRGEADLYMAFMGLTFEILKPGGTASFLVPGGLIRSQGTQPLRHQMFTQTQKVSISVLDNKARFFSIDTRFKFLSVCFQKIRHPSTTEKNILVLTHEKGTLNGTVITDSAEIPLDALKQIRQDWTIPEVRSQQAWELFYRLSKQGQYMTEPDSAWEGEFCREVDMTKHRSLFLSEPNPEALPLIEGRQVHLHRLGVKGYVSGTGRSAVWESYPLGKEQIRSQFYILGQDLPSQTQKRIQQFRAGFCDITGQTNERSMMAAMIPPGVACGNKVPTLIFKNDENQERLWVWLAIVNSLAFDWMLRRVLTTTVNYFLLQSIPLPLIEENSVVWKTLVQHSKYLYGEQKITSMDEWIITQNEIDNTIAEAYGLRDSEWIVILSDFKNHKNKFHRQ